MQNNLLNDIVIDNLIDNQVLIWDNNKNCWINESFTDYERRKKAEELRKDRTKKLNKICAKY